MPLNEYCGISLVNVDGYYMLEHNGLCAFLSEDELEIFNEQVENSNINRAQSQAEVSVKIKISKMLRASSSINNRIMMIFDVVIIGAGVAGLCCAHKVLEDGKAKSILFVSENIGGSLLMTKHFGLGFLPSFILETASFMKSTIQILTHHNVLLCIQEAQIIDACDSYISVKCENTVVHANAVVIATGCLNKIYLKYKDRANVLDSFQIMYHKKYRDLIKNKSVIIVHDGKTESIDYGLNFQHVLYLDIADLFNMDITVSDAGINTENNNMLFDYLVFDVSSFSPNHIIGESIVPDNRIFYCGDVLRLGGVLHAINTGIEAGKKICGKESS